MSLTVRKVANDVEICCLKRCTACFTYKACPILVSVTNERRVQRTILTLFVITASKATVSSLDRFAYNRFRATSAFAFASCGATPVDRWAWARAPTDCRFIYVFRRARREISLRSRFGNGCV